MFSYSKIHPLEKWHFWFSRSQFSIIDYSSTLVWHKIQLTQNIFEIRHISLEALWYTIIFLHKKFTDLFLNESDKSRYKISDQKCYFFMLLQTKTELLDYFVCFFVKMPLWISVQRPWSSGHTFAPFLGRRARVSAHQEPVWYLAKISTSLVPGACAPYSA